MDRSWEPRLGAIILADGHCRFRVWSPEAKALDLHLLGDNDRFIPMQRDERGFFQVVLPDIVSGRRYLFRVDGTEYADPASRSQPEGVFGPSEVVDSRFNWHDADWRGLPLEEQIMYELHVGTYTAEGTFDALIPHLDGLVDLGINSLEIMPIVQFPGERSWGYDGVFLFAAQDTYGGPLGLKRLVDACHQRGIAVILDTVYNHFGPEGNCMPVYAPYTTDKYKTPWGEAINTDGPYSDEVRAFFYENAVFWLEEYHIDALRLDAIHYIFDFSPLPFMQELVRLVHDYGRRSGRLVYVIAETDLNDANLVRDPSVGGIGMDAQWLDDFHHALHTVVTHEDFAYYKDFGAFGQLVKAMREGFVYTGQYAPSRKQSHGTSSSDIDGRHFVAFIQNHDQIGNRMPNDRITTLFGTRAFKLAIGVVLTAPYIPLLFMGDEYGETTPFEFFAEFSDDALCEAVRKGRVATFGHLLGDGEEPPDPMSAETFSASKLNHKLRELPAGQALFDYHRTLISLRKANPLLRDLNKHHQNVLGYDDIGVLYVHRRNEYGQIVMIFNFDEKIVSHSFPVPPGHWRLLFDSSDPRWRVPGESRGAGVTQAPIVTSSGDLSLDLSPQGFFVYYQPSNL